MSKFTIINKQRKFTSTCICTAFDVCPPKFLKVELSTKNHSHLVFFKGGYKSCLYCTKVNRVASSYGTYPETTFSCDGGLTEPCCLLGQKLYGDEVRHHHHHHPRRHHRHHMNHNLSQMFYATGIHHS